MAFAITNVTGSGHLRSFFARVPVAIGEAFIRYAEAQSRHGEIEALIRLSDAELAQRGLTRDGIARHVFSDRFYL